MLATGRSPSLNPASVPFFPTRTGRADVGESVPVGLDTNPSVKQRSGTESLVSSSDDFHSVIPTADGSLEDVGNNSEAATRTPSKTHTILDNDLQRGNDIKREVTPSADSALGGETAILHMPENNIKSGEDTPGPLPIYQWVLGAQAPARVPSGHESADFPTNGLFYDQRFTPPNVPTRSVSYNLPFKSTSPVSSISSASAHTSSVDFPVQSFEAQIKASPTIRELIDRLSRCEQSNRDIQRELSEIHGKVNLLVDRSLGSLVTEPEFHNPFATTPSAMRLGSLTPSGALTPHKMTPPHGTPTVKVDEINQLSNKINTLTTSVGQLLALQTQQHVNSVSQKLLQPHAQLQSQSAVEIPPNQMVSPQTVNQASLLGHGVPHRPELRPGSRNPPMRTWSAGTLDLPIRPFDGHLGRPEGIRGDKRRSVVSMRRDSAGLGFGLPEAADWGNNGSPRDSGPVASKWEHLPLAPDLLRSLNKFGVGPPNKIQQRALPFLLKGSDIIAQAPPTQERIAAYVIPAIHVAVTQIVARTAHHGPIVVIISTTVDQATQAQRMIRDLGGPIGVRSALGVGATGPNSDISQELLLLQQNLPHVLCGTPQKLHALFTAPGGLSGAEVRFLVLDEVDQLIARNLHDFVLNIVKILPPPRLRGAGTPGTSPSSSGASHGPFVPTEQNDSALASPFQASGRRFSAISISSNSVSSGSVTPPPAGPIERQTALFSNTVPQDVLNLANAIQLREAVRVLVRRDGNVTQTETSQATKGLRQFYLYLAFAAGSRSDPSAAAVGGGHGIIGSGRGASSAETAQAREWKLDALSDMLDDIDVSQVIVHVGGMTALDTVVYKLASKGLEAVPLHSDMNAGTKLAALNKFRGSTGSMIRPAVTRILVAYDVQVKAPDVYQVPLVINYDLPQAVEEYAHRVAPAISNNLSRAGVVVNFVTAAGGDVEMLRSIECFYKIKCPEVPMSLRDLL